MNTLHIVTVATCTVTACILLGALLSHPTIQDLYTGSDVQVPMPEAERPVHTVSGFYGEYHFDNQVCETIIVSGFGHEIYVDPCDDVKISGASHKIIRVSCSSQEVRR